MVNSRFKFRAWDKENEVMIYPKGVLFDGRVVNFSCGMLESFEGYELMQCTGLYDKNQKPIFEGDIVKNVGPHTPRVFTSGLGEFEYLDDILVVCREEVGFTLRTIEDFLRNRVSESCFYGFAPNCWYGKKPPVDNYQFWNFQRSFEVIGNIYENPELLEESK